MVTEIKTGIFYEYNCSVCGIKYTEQRYPSESQFFTQCQKMGCNGTYELYSETEFTYEQEIPDQVPPTLLVEEVTPTPELEG